MQTHQPLHNMPGTKFETEMQVRPDDIDMNRHVHGSRYMDYVLAARYDQMARCYKMPMEEFLRHGFGWFVRTAHVEYKRPLGLGERFIVRTWIEEIVKRGVKVQFEILKHTGPSSVALLRRVDVRRRETSAPVPRWKSSP